MASAEYYRQEAERARQQAVNSKDPETILRWLKIVKDYHALANAMEAEERAPSPSVSQPVSQSQQQPVQQQQAKSDSDDKK